MRLRILLAAAVSLAACSRPMQLPTHQFDVPVPEAWHGGEADPSAPTAEWWAYFEDDLLDAAIRKALACNENLRAAAARVTAASEESLIAGAAKRPEIGLGVNRMRQRQNFVGLPFPGLSDRVLSNTFSNAGMAFNVAWESDFWNRIRAGRLAAEATARQREADRQAAMLSLSGQAAKAWVAAIEARRQIGLAEAVLANAETSAERTRERYRFGSRSTPVDVRVAEADVARAALALEQRRQVLGAVLRQIESLACEYPDGDHAVADRLPELAAPVPAGLPSELVHRRPDLLASEQALLAADARIVQARAALRPSFSLTAGAGTSSNTLLDLVNPGLRVWDLALGLAQPLFDGGRLKANVRATEARATEAEALHASRMRAAYLEVETALSAEGSLIEQERSLVEALESTRLGIALAEGRFSAGMGDVLSVLALERAALETESALLALRRTKIDNRIDLHLALGGGFPDPPDAPQQAVANQ